MSRRPLPTILAAIALTAISVPLPAQQPAPSLAPGEALIQVVGTGKVTAIPDRAEIETGVVADGATSERALAANAAGADRLIASLRTAGLADRAIRTTAVRVAPRYRKDAAGNDTDQILGYRAVNRLRVEVEHVETAGVVIDALSKAGASDIDGPAFSFSDDAPLLARARAAAVQKAERQAHDYAAALGLSKLRVIRVSERSSDIGIGNDIVVTGSRKTTPIRPGEQEIGVTVWIDYAATR